MTARASIGKRVRGARYVHVSALGTLEPGQRRQIESAREIVPDFHWNVARIEEGGTVGLLDYRDFDTEAFPVLAMAARVDLKAGAARITDYRRSRNPLILHRKELLVADDYPGRGQWAALSERLGRLGLFSKPHRIGRRDTWLTLLGEARLDPQGRRLP